MSVAVASSQGGYASSNGQDPAPAATSCPLPRSYTSMNDVIQANNAIGKLVNVVGLVKDCRLPFVTKTGDYKMTLKLYDMSLQEECITLDVHMFSKRQEDMPVVSAADVVLIRSAKVQEFRGDRSLLTNANTSIYVYSSVNIPPEPQQPSSALRPSTWNSNKNRTPPTLEEGRYASWLFHNICKDNVPTAVDFDARAAQSLKIADKYTTLKDVTETRFYDLIVRVAHKPVQSGDTVTIWITDFTENARFRDFGEPDGTHSKGTQISDSYGYLTESTAMVGSKQISGWQGPLGKLSMQVTCYEPHADYIRSYVTVNKWVELRNVQVHMGRNGAYLEGFMRGDPMYGNPVRVSCIDVHPEDRDSVDPRFKNALRRFRDYTIRSKAALSQKKRKADGELPPGKKQNRSKKQRRMKRANNIVAYRGDGEKGDAEAQHSSEGTLVPNLNSNIVSDHQDHTTTKLADAIEPVCCEATTSDGKTVQLPLPFVNAKFRTQVRVVDFIPSRLEEFAASRRTSELDILSDNECDVEDDSDDDDGGGTGDGAYGPLIWEWRFALLLEDATPSATAPARIWAVVDNAEAQMLTGLNACDLRCDIQTLDRLRERMFVLWGDLEERKRLQLRAKREAEVAAAATRRKEKQQKMQEEQQRQQMQQAQQKRAQNGKTRKAYAQPQDSSGDEWVGKTAAKPPAARSNSSIPAASASASASASGSHGPVSNRPFVCCVRQYGVRVQAPAESHSESADDESSSSSSSSNSGTKATWQRVFGLFGTKINAM